MVCPLTRHDTERSPAAPSEAVSFSLSVEAGSLQPVAGFTNVYAEPWSGFGPMSSKRAATTTVSPLIDDRLAELSLAAPSEAVSVALWVHVLLQPPTGFTNTYAEPWSAFAPMLSR